MTTIVGDAKRKVIVSDSQLSDTDSDTKTFTEEKVFRVPQGWLAGAGDFKSIQDVVKYFREGKKGKEPVIKDVDDADFMLLTEDGLFTSDRNLRFWEVKSYDAIGNGTMAALACMTLGHTAEEAVWASCQTELYSGEPVRVYELKYDTYQIWKKE